MHTHFSNLRSDSDEQSTILVVDDQDHNIQVVGSTLASFGYEVMVATSGEEALTRVASRVPDLILLDVRMPGMDGFTLCKTLSGKPETAEVPIIFLSASDEKNVVVRALEAGGVDYVTKPFNKAELLARVRTHLELKTTRDELSKSLRRQEEFTSTLAHDLKNPLGGVKFSAQMLKESAAKEGVSEKVSRLANSVQDGTDRALAIIERMLSEVHSASADIDIQLSAVNLNECIGAVVRRFQGWCGKKNIELEWSCPNTPVIASACPHALIRVVENLISNAIKFSPVGKKTRVLLSKKDDEAVITVSDQGPGFTEEDKELMFQRFTRLSARPTDGEQSTGLGLSIVRQLTERMGGVVGLESSLGQGSTFTVALKVPS